MESNGGKWRLQHDILRKAKQLPLCLIRQFNKAIGGQYMLFNISILVGNNDAVLCMGGSEVSK